MNIKNAVKKLGHRACLRVSGLLKWGIFTACALKIPGYPKDTKFYLERKLSFIDMSSIASFKLFLVAWLRECCTFSDSSVVSLKSWPWSKYIQ